MVTATGKVLVFPWSAWAGGAMVTPATILGEAAALRPFSGRSSPAAADDLRQGAGGGVDLSGVSFDVDGDVGRPDLQGDVEGRL